MLWRSYALQGYGRGSSHPHPQRRLEWCRQRSTTKRRNKSWTDQPRSLWLGVDLGHCQRRHRRVRSGGCRNSRRNCTIVRNSPWSAKASGVVRGHPHTNYPDTKPGPDPSGQASSTRAPGNAHRGPHALELTDPARPDVHTVPPHRSVVSVVLPVVLRMSLQRF